MSERFRPFDPDNLPADARAVYDRILAQRGYVPGPFQFWLASPGFADRIEPVEEFLRHDVSLEERLVEITVLVVAKHWRAQYVWTSHGPAAEKAGVAPAIVEAIRAGEELSTYSKKMQSALNREYRKMFRNLNGMRTMDRLPECVVVIDPKKERNSIREARKLGITTIALIDTDCDPDDVDLPIPGNDDGIRSIELILRHLADAVQSGNMMLANMHQKRASGQVDTPKPQSEPTGEGAETAAG